MANMAVIEDMEKRIMLELLCFSRLAAVTSDFGWIVERFERCLNPTDEDRWQ
jgi:hypothetical protein